ncbi:MAG: hypothetical protein NC124_02405 [Clostridium sp.]|nr:hypothetical protein [Clostridium sp.]
MKIGNIIITTKRKYDDLLMACLNALERNNNLHTWAAIRSVIYDLKELRENTWDKNRVDNMIGWLKENFEVIDE